MDYLKIIERKLLYKELEPFFKSLECIDYAVIKGEALSQQIYGIPNKRNSSDIDILVNKQDVLQIENELRKIGFSQKSSEDKALLRRNRILCMTYSHQIPSYHKTTICGIKLNVDINYDIFWGEYEGEHCKISEFLNDTVPMCIYGVPIKTLPIPKAFLQLILHHYKETNSLYHLSYYNYIKTRLFQDIRDMLIYNKIILKPKVVYDLCNEYSVGCYMYYMIYYTSIVFDDSYLKEILEHIKEFRNDRLINSFGLNNRERKEWMIPFEERLDNDEIWPLIKSSYNNSDKEKIKLNNAIFT